jgi:hypothetical protein
MQSTSVTYLGDHVQPLVCVLQLPQGLASATSRTTAALTLQIMFEGQQLEETISL